MTRIPFNKPCLSGNELKYMKEAVYSGKISGDGLFSRKCTKLLEKKFSAKKVMLTPSATAALEMTALLIGIRSGDEVIVPSFTFTSTANAFVLFGAQPIFVDVRPDTLNIDEEKIEENISPKTKAIYCMHYAGVACAMGKIKKIAKKYKLFLIEDAAQCINSMYKNQYLGTIGDLGVYSFHETKNCNCGEGGALIINNPKFIERAEIIREKGTDRSKFFRGEVDRYTWKDYGSSYLLSDILAAFLFAQLENLDKIIAKRKKIYNFYYKHLKIFQEKGQLRLPFTPDYSTSNYHLFYILLNSRKKRDQVMAGLKKAGILAVFHYLPLHTSFMGRRFGYKTGDLPVTEDLSGKLLRLPLYNSLTNTDLKLIISTLGRLLE